MKMAKHNRIAKATPTNELINKMNTSYSSMDTPFYVHRKTWTVGSGLVKDISCFRANENAILEFRGPPTFLFDVNSRVLKND